MAGTPAPIDPAPAAPATQAPESAPAAAPSPLDLSERFYKSIETPELRNIAAERKWDNPDKILKSYRELESMKGAPADQLAVLPKVAADAKTEDYLQAMAPVFDKMGRPKTADDYKLTVPEGDDGEFAKTAAKWFHEIGLNQRQATAFNERWNAFWSGKGTAEAANTAAEAQARDAKATADLNQLRREWGGQYDERVELGRRVVRENGTDPDTLTKIEEAIGTAPMLRLFGNIGRHYSEATYQQSSRPQNFGVSPSEAQARLNQLIQDKEWGRRLLANPGGPEAQEQDNLQRIAAQLGRQM